MLLANHWQGKEQDMKQISCPTCGHLIAVAAESRKISYFLCQKCGGKVAYKKTGLFKRLFGSKKTSQENQISHKQIDNLIEMLEFVPIEYQKDLTDVFGSAGAIIRSVGRGEQKLACLFLILPEDHFKVRLDGQIKIKVRFPVTKTPHGVVISSCVQVFDTKSPGLDEHFHLRDKHLRIMIEQDHTFLIIADQQYRIYFRRKIKFDGNMKKDLGEIQNAFVRYGEQSEHPTIGNDPAALYALQWYQSNVSMQDILHQYF